MRLRKINYHTIVIKNEGWAHPDVITMAEDYLSFVKRVKREP